MGSIFDFIGGRRILNGFIFQCLLTGKSSVKNITFSSLNGNFLNGLLVPRYQVNGESPVKSSTENSPLSLNGEFSVKLLTGDSLLSRYPVDGRGWSGMVGDGRGWSEMVGDGRGWSGNGRGWSGSFSKKIALPVHLLRQVFLNKGLTRELE